MTNRLRICLVNPFFIPERSSGQGIYAEKIARAMATRHDVTVVTGTWDRATQTERMENMRVIRIPALRHDPSRWLYFGYLAGGYLTRLNRRERFHLVHFLDGHLGYRYRGPSVATLHQSFDQRLRGDAGRPYHSSITNLLKRYPYYRVSRWLEKMAVRNTGSFISVSHATKLEFVLNYNIYPSKIQVVHNGIDIDLFKPVSADDVKKRFHIGDSPVILYVGFSTPRKGLEYLAQAFDRLQDRSCTLVMVGKWEKGYREKFYRYIGGSKDRVVEAGYVADSDLPAFYSLADIFVLPSLLEGFGFPLVEAMACNTPVIGTDVGSIPEVIGDCGVIVPPRDAGALARAIDSLLRDPEQMASLQARSRQRVCTCFSDASMIEKTEQFYQKTIHAVKRRQTRPSRT